MKHFPGGECARGLEHVGPCEWVKEPESPNEDVVSRLTKHQRYYAAHKDQRREYQREYMRKRRAL